MKQTRMGAFEVKTHLSQILKDVQKGDEILITKRGEPIAKIVPCEPTPSEIGQLLAEFSNWCEHEAITWGKGMSIEEAKHEGRK